MIAFFPSRTVAVEIAGFAVHWYGLLYVAAFFLAYVLVPRLQALRGLALSRDQWAETLTRVILGVIIGGRMGYVLLYDPGYFLMHPAEIFAVWKGGMSSHGGFLGAFLGLLISARRMRVSLLALGDVAAVPAAVGLALGRIGNVINQELYGRVTSVPWAIAIPGVEGLRHPTAHFAVGKDLFLALLCLLMLRRFRHAPSGTVSGIFLLGYGILRFLLEFLREPTHTPFMLGSLILTRGQLYTLPLMVCGAWLLLRAVRRARG